jgi:hypothetical protein
MKKILVILAVMLIAIPVASQEREDVFEAASFVSIGQIGLNYVGISPQVKTFVGPAYTFNEDSAIMLGFSMNFGSGNETNVISAFLGGNFTQYIGLGYSFELVGEDAADVEAELAYGVRHSILFGVLARHPDFE